MDAKIARFKRKAKTNSQATPAARDTPGFTPCARGPRVLQQAVNSSSVGKYIFLVPTEYYNQTIGNTLIDQCLIC